jgi:hypothetical protein
MAAPDGGAVGVGAGVVVVVVVVVGAGGGRVPDGPVRWAIAVTEVRSNTDTMTIAVLIKTNLPL